MRKQPLFVILYDQRKLIAAQIEVKKVLGYRVKAFGMSVPARQSVGYGRPVKNNPPGFWCLMELTWWERFKSALLD